MPENLKITAILPCFNHAHFLGERIKTVLSQTHLVDQIIFLDDASTDESVAIAKRLLRGFSGQVDICINSINSGSPFAQWNKGIGLAKHDLIWIAETDDACDAKLIEKLYSAFKNSSIVLSFAQSRCFDAHGHDLGSAVDYTDQFWPGAFSESFTMEGSDFIKIYMSALNAIPNASAVLFKKEAFLAAGMANSTMRLCGDWDVWIRLCWQGKILFIADELNYFRRHSSTSRAIGYTPDTAAEYLACRIRVWLNNRVLKDNPVSALDLIRGLIDPLKREQLVIAIGSLNQRLLPYAKKRYQAIADIPRLSRDAWALLSLFYYLESLLALIASYYHRLSSRAFKAFNSPNMKH